MSEKPIIEQMKAIFLLSFFCIASSFASDCCFPSKDHPWCLEADYRIIGKAKFRHHYSHSDLKYSDAYGSLSYLHILNPQNMLTYQIGASYLDLDWDKNPRFEGEKYTNAIGSLTFSTTSMRRFRWIFTAGATVDATTFDFGHSGVYYGLVWGRYKASEKLGAHIGVFSYGGIHNSYTLPVLGIDWQYLPAWKRNLIFPLDLSLEYQLNTHWSSSLAYSTFGAPYRYPYRAHKGIGRFKDAIFEVYSNGVDLNLNYKTEKNFTAGIGGGWNFGGWILIKNAHNQSGKYYKFKSAPYAQAYATFTF